VVDDLTDLCSRKGRLWRKSRTASPTDQKTHCRAIQLSRATAVALPRSQPVQPHAVPPPRGPPDIGASVVCECSVLNRTGSHVARIPGREFSQFSRVSHAGFLPHVQMKSSPRPAVFWGPPGRDPRAENPTPNLPSIRADERLLRRVVVNLLDNAAGSMLGRR